MPISSGPQQSLNPLPSQRFQAPDIGAAGRTLGEGMQDLGKSLGEAAQVNDKLNDQYAEARAKDLDNQYQTFERDTLYGEHGFLTQEGQNALNTRSSTEEALQKKRAELLSATQDPKERMMLEGVFNQRANETGTTIARHANEQGKVYFDQQSTSRIDNASQSYATYAASDRPEDKAIAQNNRATALAELGDMAQRHGWAGDVYDSKKRELLTGLHKDTIEALSLTSPTKAAAYLEANKGEMDPLTVHTLNAQLQPLEAQADAKNFVDQYEQHGAPLAMPTTQQAPGQVPGTLTQPKDLPNADAVFARMIHQESGGRQLDSRGLPLTSSAGAVGVGQLMPATAHMMQAALGLPVNDSYKTDAAQNRQLSRAYFGRLLHQFHGDVTKAVAAYNAGPGRIRSTADWANHLPAETRDYVHKVLGPDAVAGGIATAPPGQITDQTQNEMTYAAGLKWIEDYIPQRLAGKPPQYIEQVQDKAKQELSERYNNRRIAINATNSAAEDQAYGQVANIGVGNFTSTSQVAGFNNLPPHIRMSLETLANANLKRDAAQQKQKTDWTAYSTYREMPTEELRKVPVENLRRDLGDTELHEMIERRTTRKDVNPGQAVTARQVVEYTKQSLVTAGIHVGVGKDAMGDAPKVAAFTNKLMTWAQGVYAQTGKWPGEDAIRQEGDRELLWGTTAPAGWIGGARHARHFEVQPGQNWRADVPDEERTRLTEALKRNGKPVTEQNIRRLYIAGQSRIYAPLAKHP